MVVVHLLGRLQQDAAEYLRIGGEGALAPLLRDQDARVRWGAPALVVAACCGALQ